MTKPKILEAVVKKTTKQVLDEWGAYMFWPVPTGFGAHTVDCLACVPIKITLDMVGRTMGLFVAIETKREGINKPTEAQQAVFDKVAAAKGSTVLVNKATVGEVKGLILKAVLDGVK